MRRFVPIILVIGIIANVVLVITYRYGLERRFAKREQQFIEYSSALIESNINNFRECMISNYIEFVKNSMSDSSLPLGSSSVSTNDSGKSLFENQSVVDFHYFLIDNIPYIKIGLSYYTLGSPSSYGGIITDIYSDCFIVDNRYRFPRSNNSTVNQSNFSLSSINHQTEVENARINN